MLAAALCVSLVASGAPGYASPPEYAKNAHVEYWVERGLGDDVDVHFRFKDDLGRPVVLELSANRVRWQEAAAKFGAPEWMTGPYLVRERATRVAQLEDHLMRVHHGSIGADPRALVREYDFITRPLAQQLVVYLQQRHRDTRQNRIALALAFIQDLPYGLVKDPPGLFRQGVLPVPLMLLNGYGDCDSKAIFFAGLMADLIGAQDVAILHNDAYEHALAAVRGTPGPGQTSVTVDGAPFVLMEVAGPVRFAPGHVGAGSPDEFEVERLVEPSRLAGL